MTNGLTFLIRHGISEIHMKHLIPIEGEYKRLGWDIPKRDAVVSEFVQAINETKMWGLGVAVDVAAWQRQKKQNPKIPWGTVQQFCLERILRRTLDHITHTNIQQPLALVFDTDPEFGANRFNVFCALMGRDQKAAKTLASITFAHAFQYPGLQCADLLVWETRKELMQKQAGYQSTKRWRDLFTKMPNYQLEYVAGERWDDDSFRDAMPDIHASLRSPSSDEVGQ